MATKAGGTKKRTAPGKTSGRTRKRPVAASTTVATPGDLTTLSKRIDSTDTSLANLTARVSATEATLGKLVTAPATPAAPPPAPPAPPAPPPPAPTPAVAPTGNDPRDFTDRSKWALTFDDDFTKGSPWGNGVTPDRTKWQFCFANGDRTLGGNTEREVYMDPDYPGSGPVALGYNPFAIDPANGGILTISADKTPADIAPKIWGMWYVSGMVCTAGSFAQQFGRFCCRMKMPKGKGLWPAFWLLSPLKIWPPELDPCEFFGAPNHNNEGGVTKYHVGMIGGAGGGAWIETGVDLTQGFHTYSCEWDAAQLRHYFDDRLVLTLDASDPVFHTPQYMIANLAVGGTWPDDPGGPDLSTEFPAKLQIDFIRAFKAK
jgi:beta-glucanase (GH16 family)